MSIRELSRKIADNRKSSCFVAFMCGMITYMVLLYSNNWNLLSLVIEGFSVELAAVTGVVMRFISGLGISLTYTTFCTFVFSVMSSSLKGQRKTARLAYILTLIPTLILIFYTSYKIGVQYFFWKKSQILIFFLQSLAFGHL